MIRDAFRRARAEASWQQWALLAVGLACAIAVRFSLGPLSTGDYTHFMKGWIEVLREQGFAAFGTSFANYNPPFLYLLYLFGLLPIGGLAVVKVIAALFDFALAAGVAAIAYRLRGSMIVAAFAGVGALFIPEVLINSGMWGQVDATYTAFLVWSVYFVLARRDIPAWVLFALALSFKLQAIFLLPWLAVAFVLQKHRWRAVAIGAGVFLLTYVPALLAGRSPGSLA
ncbi:MAG TPA: glycosyltransferase 87 family protein, partial [Rhodoglobus sp.]|nr:glycosyltransferase 87 family protein [Rhodoglobus sp.]